MSEEWEAYVKDSRTICKYGNKCYQTNADHHEHFKHPPNNNPRKLGHSKIKNRFTPFSRNKPSKEASKMETDSSESQDTLKEEETESKEEATQSDVLVKYENNVHLELPSNIMFYDKDADPKTIEELFLMKMPTDFYKFYDCLQQESESIEKQLSGVNLQLIGPYDLLTGKLPILDVKELYLIHWRFFYDPPEFQAVLKCQGKSQYHIGYFRDDPNDAPEFLGSNDSAKNCQITAMADNIFGAVYLYLQNEKEKSPFASAACHKFMEKIKKWADEHSYSIEKYNIKKRLIKCVSKTFHGAGISAPYNKKTQLGYRRLTESDANIKKLFAQLELAKSQNEKDKILSELQPVITYANIAVDECDFGTGLEMGIDLFSSGLKELEPSALSCLSSAYSLLNRSAFQSIIQIHLKYRRRGPNMSVLSK